MRRSLLPVCALLLGSPALAADPVAVTTRAEADGSRTLVHELLVPASTDAVWTAIATPEGWMTWAVPVAWFSTADPEILETSYDPADKPGSATTILQRLLARIPGRVLAYRTVKAPEGFPHWESYRKVVSLFELEPAGAQTRVRLTSTGYPDSPAGQELIAFFTRGNAMTLEELRKRFADGPVDWRKRLGGAETGGAKP